MSIQAATTGFLESAIVRSAPRYLTEALGIVAVPGASSFLLASEVVGLPRLATMSA